MNLIYGYIAAQDDVPHEVARGLAALAFRAHNRLQSGVDENSVREQWPDAFKGD